MKPEEKAELTLYNWLTQHNCKVWLNRHSKNIETQIGIVPIFTTKGNNKKPDMIIWTPKKKQYIAIEIKPGDTSREIYNASKIIEYWEKYHTKETRYFINQKEIQINSFTIATKYSPQGKLFKDDNQKNTIENCKDDQWKLYCRQNGLEPTFEFKRTSDYIRNLWAQWRKIRKSEPAPGIGLLLSNVLNNKNNSPLLFDMQYEHQTKKSKWQNRQKEI